ncbi:hypothetical protein RJ639_029402 [Escallonia herrerae]|uniref:Retrotransposon gag domain-containing protein n=1 Tax=Escallonia herrerae TaxID=1293975 RepID=A0AA88QLM0_9ASTE|nr:hypothetical protein RJ639_029402 [Escallonia herrerae]
MILLVALVLVLLEERVPLASWNLEGDAQLWYQLLKEKRGEHCITWQVFKDELFERFGPTRYQDFFGDLTKLQQSGTVKEYHTQFSILLLRAGQRCKKLFLIEGSWSDDRDDADEEMEIKPNKADEVP